MKRREFVEKIGLGSAALITPSLAGAAGAQNQNQRREEDEQHDHDEQEDLEGSEAHAVISFGQWKTDPPIDRYVVVNPPPAANNHQLLPRRVTIKAGGSVSFIISGLHQVIVYGPGKEPEDVDTNKIRPTTGVPAGLPLINDDDKRIYAGPDPSLHPRDRVESVHFPHPGKHLVICGVRGHFLEGMLDSSGWRTNRSPRVVQEPAGDPVPHRVTGR